MSELHADVIVVGSGAGGGFAAAALADAGLSVLLFERGRWFDYRQDFPTRHQDWELRVNPFQLGTAASDPSIEYTPGAIIDPSNHDICSRPRRDAQVRTQRRGRFRYERVFGVGGTTLQYQGEAHRYARHAFQPGMLFGQGVDWPLSYDDLEPYYAKAEDWLGVAGTANNPFKPNRGPFPTAAHPLSTKSQWVKSGADSLGWSLLPNALALPSNTHHGRPACQRAGVCTLGCPFGAKASVDLAVLPHALKTGRLRILDQCRVVELESRNEHSVEAIIYIQNGEWKRATADRYIIACGAAETPRLLLTSQSSVHPHGIGNQNGQVGKNLMETIMATVTVEADIPVFAWKGPPIDARIWDFSNPGESRTGGFVLGVSGTMGPLHGPISHANQFSGFGRKHKEAMRDRFGRFVNLFGIADHQPDSKNQLALADTTDDVGIPKIIIDSDYGEVDRHTIRVMMDRLLELADACRPTRTMGLFSTYSHPSVTHLSGTCRMGSDALTSVCNEFGQVHGVKNLFIADSSILPGQGMGDSPSLTIHALALRTAEHMSKNIM